VTDPRAWTGIESEGEPGIDERMTVVDDLRVLKVIAHWRVRSR